MSDEPEPFLNSTPLHEAAEMGDTGRVIALLEEGADIEARDWRDHTPLLAAASADFALLRKMMRKVEADLHKVHKAEPQADPFALLKNMPQLDPRQFWDRRDRPPIDDTPPEDRTETVQVLL